MSFRTVWHVGYRAVAVATQVPGKLHKLAEMLHRRQDD